MPRNFIDQPHDGWPTLSTVLTIGDLSLINNQQLEVFRRRSELRAAQTLIGLHRFASDACFAKENWLTNRTGSLILAVESIQKLAPRFRWYIRHIYGIDCAPINFRHAQDVHGVSGREGQANLYNSFFDYREKLASTRCTWRSSKSGELLLGDQSKLVSPGRFCEWGCICGFTENPFIPNESVLMHQLERFENEGAYRKWFKGLSGKEYIAPTEIIEFLNNLVRSAISFTNQIKWGDGLDSRAYGDSGQYIFGRSITISDLSHGAVLIQKANLRVRKFTEPLKHQDPVWMRDFENPYLSEVDYSDASVTSINEINPFVDAEGEDIRKLIELLEAEK